MLCPVVTAAQHHLFIYLFLSVYLVVVCGLLDTIHLHKQDMGLVEALCPG